MEPQINNSGVASRLVTIHDLATLSFDTKVRFLGCVEHYDLDKGLIYFSEPHYDKNLHSKDYIQVVAGVEISLVDVKAEQLEAGNWMNVIGYIDETKYKPLINGDKMVQGIKIRAQLIWDTGTMDVRAYFGSIAARKKTFD